MGIITGTLSIVLVVMATKLEEGDAARYPILAVQFETDTLGRSKCTGRG